MADFAKATSEYAEAVVALEREEHRSGLEPFDAKAGKIRSQVTQALDTFKTSYDHGYKLLMAELEPNQIPTVDLQNLAIFQDNDALLSALSEGKSLHELIGFSWDSLKTLYQAGLSLFDKHKFSEAQDAFFFLATIAPLVPEFWIGLGYANAECQHNDAAIFALKRAINLRPDLADGYLLLIRVYVQKVNFTEAFSVCNEALDFAKDHKGDIWAEGLVVIIEEAKNILNSLYQKSPKLQVEN